MFIVQRNKGVYFHSSFSCIERFGQVNQHFCLVLVECLTFSESSKSKTSKRNILLLLYCTLYVSNEISMKMDTRWRSTCKVPINLSSCWPVFYMTFFFHSINHLSIQGYIIWYGMCFEIEGDSSHAGVYNMFMFIHWYFLRCIYHLYFFKVYLF